MQGVEKKIADLFLLFFCSFNLQLLIQVLSDLPRLVLGFRSERTPELCTYNIDELEKGCHKPLGVFDL